MTLIELNVDGLRDNLDEIRDVVAQLDDRLDNFPRFDSDRAYDIAQRAIGDYDFDYLTDWDVRQVVHDEMDDVKTRLDGVDDAHDAIEKVSDVERRMDLYAQRIDAARGTATETNARLENLGAAVAD